MNKPEILKGEVKEFIDMAYYVVFELVTHNTTPFFERIIPLYSQPFKPEMITEYFEGWESFEGDVLSECFRNKENEIVIGNAIYAYSHIEVNEDKFPTMPKTLSQFITNAIQADIKLYWKEV
jgi:hypothetical protein